MHSIGMIKSYAAFSKCVMCCLVARLGLLKYRISSHVHAAVTEQQHLNSTSTCKLYLLVLCLLTIPLLLQSTLQRVSNRNNVADMSCQPFYAWIKKTYTWHVVGLFAALYALGGFPAMVWGGALRIAWVYHITWFVNSASHCWGYQSYKTGIDKLPTVQSTTCMQNVLSVEFAELLLSVCNNPQISVSNNYIVNLSAASSCQGMHRPVSDALQVICHATTGG